MKYLYSSLLIFFFPLLAEAQLVPCEGTDCDFCSFAQLADNIVLFIVTTSVVIAILLMAYAGVNLAASLGDDAAMKEAKGYASNVIIGILIILGGWLLVDTAIKLLTGSDLGVWNPVECGGMTAPSGLRDVSRFLNEPDYDFDPADIIPGVDIDYDVGADGMVQIPGSEYYASPGTVERFLAMQQAAAADGITLTVTDGYRSDALQLQYWTEHGCLTNPALCNGVVARPISLGGSGSNHNRGIALDLSTPYGSPAFNWMRENGGTYGFYNNLGPDDPWHWSPSGR